MRPYNALVGYRMGESSVYGAWTHLMLYELYIFIESITRVPLIRLMCMINGFIYTSASNRHRIHVICLCAAARESLQLLANGFQFSFFLFRWINARAYLLVVCCAVSCKRNEKFDMFAFHCDDGGNGCRRTLFDTFCFAERFSFGDKSAEIRGFVLYHYFSY